MNKVVFTHYGWFGLCPILIADPESDMPTFEARYPFTDWLFTFSEWMFDRCNDIMALRDPEHENSFTYRISGQFETPVERPIEEE